jgi:hypothetical protein
VCEVTVARLLNSVPVRPLPGPAGLVECQGPLVSEMQLRVASATNTDELGLIPSTGNFLNWYSENLICGPEIQMAPLETRLTNRRHQHQQSINHFLTCSVLTFVNPYIVIQL